MVLDQAANNVSETLSSSITNTDTTIPVSNASAFPDPANGEYNVVIDDTGSFEVVRVTGYDTTNDTLTVTRAQESTSAVSHSSGTSIELSYTSKFRDDIDTELSNLSSAGAEQEVTASGDGTTTTFTLSHGFGTTSVDVQPKSEDASTDFYISAISTSSVDITYAAAPPSGTDNLVYKLTTNSASTAKALSDSGTDTDGGNDYQFPQAADNLDLQGDGAIRNADTVGIGTSVTYPNGTTETSYPPGTQRLIANGLIVARWDGNIQTFDPGSLTTPFQDAIDAINATGTGTRGGKIIFPHGTVQDSSTQINALGDKLIHGQGTGDNDRTLLEFTDTTAEAFNISGPRDLEDCRFQDIMISGSSASTRTTNGGTATQCFNLNGGSPDQWQLDNVVFAEWGDRTINVDGGNPFDSDWGYVEFASSCQGDNLYFNDGGMIQCDYLRGNSSNGGNIIENPGGNGGMKFVCGYLNVGGAPNIAVHNTAQEGSYLEFGHINFEPSDQSNVSSPIDLQGGAATVISGITNWADCDQVVKHGFNAHRLHIKTTIRNTGTIANNLIHITSDPSGSSTYGGQLSDIGTSTSAGTITEPNTVYAVNGPFTN